MRIYKVVGADKPRLVQANNQAQAIGHVVRNQFKATVATQADLVDLLPGTKVEKASSEE